MRQTRTFASSRCRSPPTSYTGHPGRRKEHLLAPTVVCLGFLPLPIPLGARPLLRYTPHAGSVYALARSEADAPGLYRRLTDLLTRGPRRLQPPRPPPPLPCRPSRPSAEPHYLSSPWLAPRPGLCAWSRRPRVAMIYPQVKTRRSSRIDRRIRFSSPLPSGPARHSLVLPLSCTLWAGLRPNVAISPKPVTQALYCGEFATTIQPRGKITHGKNLTNFLVATYNGSAGILTATSDAPYIRRRSRGPRDDTSRDNASGRTYPLPSPRSLTEDSSASPQKPTGRPRHLRNSIERVYYITSHFVRGGERRRAGAQRAEDSGPPAADSNPTAKVDVVCRTNHP